MSSSHYSDLSLDAASSSAASDVKDEKDPKDSKREQPAAHVNPSENA